MSVSPPYPPLKMVTSFMDGHIDAGEIEDEDDEEYNPPSKKIKKEKNSDEENTSPQKKDQKLPKPTRFSMMLDDSSIVVNTPDPKPKIKKEPMVSVLKFIQLRRSKVSILL